METPPTPAETPTPEPAPEPPTPPETPEPEAEEVSMPKAEVDALRRELAEARKTARKADTAAKKAEEAKAAEEGKWEELAKQREREAEEASAKLQRAERQMRVSKIARRLKFRDPDDAFRLLDADDLDDEQAVESALKRLAQDKEYLTDSTERSGAPINPGRSRAPKDMNRLIREKAGRA